MTESTVNAESRIQTASRIVTLGLFLLPLLAGGVGAFVDLDPTRPVAEKRALAPAPTFDGGRDVVAIAKDAQRWVDDHFGFRDALLRMNAHVRVRALQSAPNDRVAVGRDGWYFLRRESHDFHVATDLFTPSELDQWRSLLIDRTEALAREGARYLLAFVPTKATMYPDRLPRSERRIGAKTRLEQLRRHLEATGAPVTVLYLEDSLRPHLGEGPLYYANDSHWNTEGAYFGYRAIADQLREWFPVVRPLDRAELTLMPTTGFPDLEAVLGLEGPNPEPLQMLVPRELNIALQTLEMSSSVQAAISGRTFAAGTGQEELPSAVIFRDSFTIPLEAVLPSLFERAVVAGPRTKHAILNELLDNETPDVVISIECERFLMLDPPAS